jgi:putative AbiEii toxin of type IV toxin-antitoxin system
MITEVEIRDLRGVHEGTLGDLSPLSILVGPNNSGKSTCLEALALVGAGFDAARVVKMLLRRGGPAHHALAVSAFGDAKTSSVTLKTVEGSEHATIPWSMIRGLVKDADHLQLAQREGLGKPLIAVAAQVWDIQGVTYLEPSGKTSTTFSNLAVGSPLERPPFDYALVDVEAVRQRGALEDAYSLIEKAGKVESVVASLKGSMPTLTDLRILKAGNDFLLHTMHGKAGLIPAYVAGDGFKRYLEIAASVYRVARGVVLLEEPESFQHPRYLRELTALLLDAAASGTQVVLSTHSIELIDSLLHAAAHGPTPAPYPTVHRLRLVDGVLRSVALSPDVARTSRDDLLEDLRA